MKQKILCLDDEEASIRLHAKLFNSKSTRLEIDTLQPLKFSDQLEKLKQELNNYSALILDLRLDLKPRLDSQDKAEYRAPTLAQELRTRASEGELVDAPIFLWSVEEKYAKSYDNDDTAQDLFDLRIYKGLFTKEVARYEEEMFSVIQGYQSITQFKKNAVVDISGLFGVNGSEGTELDARFTSKFEYICGTAPVHSVMRFLRRELIDRPGLLLNEKYLVALLGIDPKKSEDYNALLDEITSVAGYTGVLSTGWKRWWFSSVIQWWNKHIAEDNPLLSLSATERTTAIKKQSTYQRLEPHPPIERSYSNYFSTICSCLQTPLDPVDGFLIVDKVRQPWQWPSYVSRKVLSNPAKYAKFNFRLEPHEQVRFDSSNT